MTAADDDCEEKVHELKHTALRNALYHAARRGFLDSVNRIFNFAVIIGGTSYAADIAAGAYIVTIGFAVAGIGALQLVFDFSGRARDHQILQQRYYAVLATLEESRHPTEDDCARWNADLLRIYADEPPTLRALDAIADNQATCAILGGDKPRMKVTLWQSVTRHLLAHNAGTFPENPGWRG